MAVRILNDFAPGDTNFTAMMETLNKAYKGQSQITISNYDTTAAPVVKVGSVFGNNGSQVLVETGDETPTGYGGIANSTTFYIYYDESGEAFIFSSTTPSWNDALQGWYNSNDRAFFSMYKDSGGTLYTNKLKLSDNGDISSRTIEIEIGDWDMDADASKDVLHLLSDWQKIRSISIVVRNDDDTLYYNSDKMDGAGVKDLGIFEFRSDAISLFRTAGGWFDAVEYNATSYNRGWVTITYVDNI